MLEKNINKYMFDNYSGAVESSFDDVLTHPESEYREEELKLLVDQVYKAGFHDGLNFMEWLSSC